MNRLRALFREVDNNMPCDWPSLRRLLIKHGVTSATLDNLFLPHRVNGGGYLVEILDQVGYQALGDHLGVWADMKDRASAAIHGKSHAIPVSGNLVVVKCPCNDQPLVFECSREGQWTYPAQPGTELILVENLENFLARDKVFPYLRDVCGVAVEEITTDIAYAAGNAITKACNTAWLAKYKTVYCFFDIDAGGFRMFEALRRLMLEHEVEVRFVAPRELAALLAKTHRQLTEKDREKLVPYQRCAPPINLLASTLLQTGKSLEQEVYLND